MDTKTLMLDRPQPLGPGDRVTVTAKLELVNDSDEPVTVMALRWELVTLESVQ